MSFTTGYKGINKEGLEYEVVDGNLSKKTRIRFLIDGLELTTTRTYLSKGLPLHPSYNRIVPGKIYKDRKGNEFEIIEKVSEASWKIKYKKDGVECSREGVTIKSGKVKHPHDGVPKVGEKYKVARGVIEVIEYVNSLNVIVRFQDGVETKTTSSDIREGCVAHPMSDLHIGQKFKTNSGWVGEIFDYKSCYEVGVKWQDGNSEYHEAAHIKSGGIKPPYQPSVVDVGYFGIGRFSNGLKKGAEKAPNKIYAYWVRMIGRCYNPSEIIKNSGRRYIFVDIHKDWFCFQNFAEWAIIQPNWNLGLELDKDLLGNGFEYSPEYCTFLPSEVNIFLAENWSKDHHNLPIGVQYIKPRTKNSKVGYVSRCHTDKGREYLGYFDDPMEAYFAYKKAKEAYARVLAEKFKPAMTRRAYEALNEYELKKVHSEKPHVCASRIITT